MARTTKTLVEGIIELDASVVPDDTAMAPFIDAANVIVTDACTGDNGPTPEYDASRLQTIETWLAAHFYTVRDPRAVNEKAGAVGAAFQSKVDLGFDTSHYGQMAMRLDTNGGLASINESTKKGTPATIGVTWPGTPYDEIPTT